MNIDLPLWKNASPKRKRIYSALFIFIIAMLVTIVGVLVPLSPQEEKLVNDQVNQTLIQGTANNNLAPSIFLNNFLLCLAMFIPLAGLPIGLFIMFSSGQAFRAIFDIVTSSGVSSATSQNISASTASLVLILITLTFFFEYVSYSIGMTESIWLFRRLTQHRWRELKTTLILIGIVAVLLTLGAIVETWAVSIPL
jgi:Stage II sporulation protein M